ncbi:TPA: MFS transporter [Klebsiella oxytoca]|uniref:MFS transporter n=1 Tax=Klebsiella oxytoca TaxID=571 RepID=A0AAN5LA07_KLEOX|nr:MFS transporter [Klebsiella oxytoca]
MPDNSKEKALACLRTHRSPVLRKYQRLVITFLVLAGVINFFDRSALSIAGTLISKDYGFTPTEMGLIFSSFTITYALMHLPVGMILEKFGVRKVYFLCIFFWSLAQLCIGFISSYSVFIFIRLVLGAGEAPHLPTCVKVSSDWYNIKERGMPMSLTNSSSMIANIIAPPTLTLVMLSFGWHSLFIITGGAGILLAFMWAVFYKNRTQVKLTHADLEYLGEESNAAKHSVTFKEWAGLFKQRTMWGMIIGFNGVGYMAFLCLSWIPMYFEKMHGLNLKEAGFVAMIPFIAALAGMYLYGFTADHFFQKGNLITSRKWLICISMLLSAFFTVILAYSETLASALIFLSLAYLFIQFAGTGAWNLVNVATPSRMVTSVSSIQNFGGLIGGMISPALTGWILATTGSFHMAFLICATISVITAVVYVCVVCNPIEELNRSGNANQ